ncbi:MAG: hypothetical protein J7K38_01895 [Thermoplasmata archaeon]|nr:hypothetical protein [Thermoplasmata archaeon]
MGGKKKKDYVKIKDGDILVKLLKTISWLDDCRWDEENQREFINFSRDDLTNSEKILTHWICYITNRQMKSRHVWEDGGYIFSALVHDYYYRVGSTTGDRGSIEELIRRYYHEDKVEKKQKFYFEYEGRIYTPRFPKKDKECIQRTLEILDESELVFGGQRRNIVAFILHIIERFKNKHTDELLQRVACALYLLTYDAKGKDILKDDEKFEKKFDKFKRSITNGKKRLWAALRDYKKGWYSKIFKGAIEEVVGKAEADRWIEIWDGLPNYQLELPGDVWNNYPAIRKSLLAKALDINSIKERKGNDNKKERTRDIPQIIRELYNQLKREGIDFGKFYPERFDITFDFAPRMCDKGLCHICIFGENGAEFICIPSKDKYCPVALICCGYTVKCRGEKNCIIRQGISKGICEPRLH